MKYNDQVVEEVRLRGRELTARFKNDPKRIMKMLKIRGKDHLDKQVSEVRIDLSQKKKCA